MHRQVDGIIEKTKMDSWVVKTVSWTNQKQTNNTLLPVALVINAFLMATAGKNQK